MTLMNEGLEILTEEDCRTLLAGGSVGRVAISIGALPAVLPVSYAVVGGAILFETGEGAKLRAALDRAVVAFQVDWFSVDGTCGWSVLAVGVSEVITDRAVLDEVRGQLRRPFGSAEQTHLVGIRPDFLSGRRFAPEGLTIPAEASAQAAQVPLGV